MILLLGRRKACHQSVARKKKHAHRQMMVAT